MHKINAMIWFHSMKKNTTSLIEHNRQSLIRTPKAHATCEFALVANNGSHMMHHLAFSLATIAGNEAGRPNFEFWVCFFLNSILHVYYIRLLRFSIM